MSLQDDVNVQVANIFAGISIAEGETLPGATLVLVDMEQVRAAFNSLQGQINELRGRLHALDGLGESPELPPDVLDVEAEADLSAYQTAGGAHLGAFASVVDLLITQSNFDGAGETE